MNAIPQWEFHDHLIQRLLHLVRNTTRVDYVRCGPGDVDLLYAARNDPALRSSLPGGPIGEDRDALARELAAGLGSLATTFVMRCAATNEPTGICALGAAHIPGTVGMSSDMTIQILPAFQHRGFGRDALTTLESAWFAAAGTPSFATTLATNVAARRLLESLQYTLQPVVFFDGRGLEGVVYRKAPP